MALTQHSDAELLVLFRDPESREKPIPLSSKIPGEIILAHPAHGG